MKKNNKKYYTGQTVEEKGIISEKEFEEKRMKILNKI